MGDGTRLITQPNNLRNVHHMLSLHVRWNQIPPPLSFNKTIRYHLVVCNRLRTSTYKLRTAQSTRLLRTRILLIQMTAIIICRRTSLEGYFGSRFLLLSIPQFVMTVYVRLPMLHQMNRRLVYHSHKGFKTCSV